MEVPLGSGISLTTQDNSGINRRIHLGTVSVTPRPFGPFNINRVSELRVHNARLEIYPRNEGVDGDQQSVEDVDFARLIRDYFEREQGVYGHISRLRASNVQIQLIGAGRGGTDIAVNAEMLINDFGEGNAPQLLNARFSDSGSEGSRFVREARWNTDTNRFSILRY